MFAMSWQKIDRPSGAQHADQNEWSCLSAFLRYAKPVPSALTTPMCQLRSVRMWNRIFAPSGDQTGPYELSLGTSRNTVTARVAASATAMWRRTSFLSDVSCVNAILPPSGEMHGSKPAATLRALLPSIFAIQTASPRANAILPGGAAAFSAAHEAQAAKRAPRIAPSRRIE